jgi:hypothetical protein
MPDCPHLIWEYMGADYWGTYDSDGAAVREQRHRCLDCGHEERDVPQDSVMVGHAPGECKVCDQNAGMLPAEQCDRWMKLTRDRRS